MHAKNLIEIILVCRRRRFRISRCRTSNFYCAAGMWHLSGNRFNWLFESVTLSVIHLISKYFSILFQFNQTKFKCIIKVHFLLRTQFHQSTNIEATSGNNTIYFSWISIINYYILLLWVYESVNGAH